MKNLYSIKTKKRVDVNQTIKLDEALLLKQIKNLSESARRAGLFEAHSSLEEAYRMAMIAHVAKVAKEYEMTGNDPKSEF